MKLSAQQVAVPSQLDEIDMVFFAEVSLRQDRGGHAPSIQRFQSLRQRPPEIVSARTDYQHIEVIGRIRMNRGAHGREEIPRLEVASRRVRGSRGLRRP